MSSGLLSTSLTKLHGGTFQKGEPHESHGEKDGESWDPSWRSFWIAQEVTKSWGLSLRNEWLIIRWLVIRFCLLLQTTSLTSSFFYYFLQIDPKVAFPRRAQPKVSRRAMDGILARLSSFKPSIGCCWRLAFVPSGCQQREVKSPGEQFCEVTLYLHVSMPLSVPSIQLGRGADMILAPSQEGVTPPAAIFIRAFYLF